LGGLKIKSGGEGGYGREVVDSGDKGYE